MLAGKGFAKVINMTGGIKAWNSNAATTANTAVGTVENGLALQDDTSSMFRRDSR